MRLDDLNIIERSKYALKINNINTLEELLSYSIVEFSGLDGIGPIVLNDIITSVHAADLLFKEEDELSRQSNLDFFDADFKYLCNKGSIVITDELLTSLNSSELNSLNELFNCVDPKRIVRLVSKVRSKYVEDELASLFNKFDREYIWGIKNEEIVDGEVDIHRLTIVNIDFGKQAADVLDTLVRKGYFYIDDIIKCSENYISGKLKYAGKRVVQTFDRLGIPFSSFTNLNAEVGPTIKDQKELLEAKKVELITLSSKLYRLTNKVDLDNESEYDALINEYEELVDKVYKSSSYSRTLK